ncbi:hypothetical protein DUPY_01310 [Duganella phyllosphaerae]|uniref:Cache domain-containing protein n=1 Tax=Duganella phyllosphaerae TaxID=762836 RepID=A0A1E7X7R8_9BURK|nr:hypothetical protein DUPY_01310 [Duganella phyllosphaerae]
MKPLGIKAKVALATSITSIMMIALVTVVQVQRVKQDFSRVLFTQQTALVGRTAEELDDKLTALLEIVAFSARKQPPGLVNSAERLRAYYQDRAILSLFDDLIVYSADGKAIADLPVVPGRAGMDVTDRAYFRQVMTTRKPMITEPVLGKYQREPIVQMIAPVLDERGEVVCILSGVLRLYKNNFLGHLRHATVGSSGYYFALTRGARPVYVLHPDPNRLLQPRGGQLNGATTLALADGFEGTVDSVDTEGREVLNSYKMLKSVDWVLGTSLPADEAYEAFDGVLARLLLWGGLASLLTALLIGSLAAHLLISSAVSSEARPPTPACKAYSSTHRMPSWWSAWTAASKPPTASASAASAIRATSCWAARSRCWCRRRCARAMPATASIFLPSGSAPSRCAWGVAPCCTACAATAPNSRSRST